MKKINFSAGPSILPQEVFEQASQAVLDFNGTGLSLLEISHRSKEFGEVLDEAHELVRELLHLPEGYHPIFLTGGASSQFFMLAMNLLSPDSSAAYVDTGTWSSKSIKEARRFGTIDVVASSASEGYTFIPTDYTWKGELSYRYMHITSNNTIYGTQYHKWPEVDMPLVVDMSSDIFSRPLDGVIGKMGLIYAGAQKNMGPAGVTLVIVREDMLRHREGELPTMLDYRTHIAKKSAYNTPPVFPIYVSMLTMRWVKAQGGLEAMEKRNSAKAKVLYDVIDNSNLFKGVARKEDRSLMNVTFTLKDKELEKPFLDFCTENNCVGIKGHRSVGGFRASIYNAMSLEGVQLLAELMCDFERRM